MKLDNRNLVLKGLLGVLPPRLERYTRSALGGRTSPEALRRLLAADGPALKDPNLADLSTQIRILTARGDDGRLPPQPPGLAAALEEVRLFRDEALHSRSLSADRALAALGAADETLRIIGAESGHDELRGLIRAVDGGRGPRRSPLDAVRVEVYGEFERIGVVGYAHAVAGVRPAVSIRLSWDRTSPDPRPVEVVLTIIEDDGVHEITEPWRLTWRASAPELNETRALVLDRAALLQVARPGSTYVRIELRGDDGATTVRRFPGPTVLPPRQWRLAGGERWAGAALATFVQPGQDAVEALVSEALGFVGEDTGAGRGGDAGADGDASAAWWDALVAAACTALRRRRPQIEAVGNAWDRGPHPVRTGAELLSARTGTSLDVAVLLAGALERLGVPAILLLTPAAALLGYWRNEEDAERIPASPQEAAELARNGTLGLVYPELAVRRSAAALHELTGRMRALALKELSDLVLAVPIRAARGRGASSQPLLELDEDGAVVELPAPDADAYRPITAAPPSGPQWPAAEAPAAGASDTQVHPRIEEWKRSLLDLSLRNPLIDCTSRHAVELLVPSTLIGRFEDIVNSRELVTLVSRGAGSRTPGGSKSRTALLTEERIVGVDLPAPDCRRRLQALAASARTTLEETGANNLYLAVGSLVWRTDGRRLHSPLILIPVTLVREGDGDAYVVGLDEAGASTPNRSLLARYEADTGIDLVELREPVRDEHGIDIEATLRRVRARLRTHKRDDDVKASVHLGLFRFSTYRMWRDLEDDWRTIADNPLVAHLLDESGAPFADPAGPLDADSDVDAIAQNLPLMADAAQARVVADAVEGRSLVVEGPPGTGKSQTVANLVFRALATGRTVMFVAEKASALDVVARRLREEAGIGDLLLNLHDNGVSPLEVRQALSRALALRVPDFDAAEAAELRARLGELRGHLERYREGLHNRDGDAPSYYEARQALVGAREGDPAELERAREVFEARARDTGLASFDVAWYNDLLRDYRDALGRLRTALTGELLGVVVARRDHVLDEAGERAEELREAISRRKGNLSIRDLMGTYGDLVTAITPCILVSPDSVARFLPVRSRYVDIVVFDEASQITVPDAVGAMGRGRSTVVVGDIRQMPPAVPSGAGGDLEGARGGERDSILDRCLAAGVTRHRLTWHYRSRVESLISFSNRHYYDGALLSFPSPVALTGPDDGPGGHGISLRRVNGGRYYGSRARVRYPGIQANTNPVEARQVVDEVLRRFEASPDSVPSIGVVTFNARQRDLIEAELRRKGPARVIAALGARDGLFVRNLENVQGEERDTILFSLTFSVNERGDMPLSFGSLGHAGGHRRFNVAITRARRQIVVFSSFDPEDLHAERSSHRGLKDLRAYLEQARARRAPRALPASRSPVDLHRNEIAEALRDAGLEVRVGVGRSAFEIDLVLTAPERPDRADREDGEDREDRPGERAVAVLLDGPGWNRRRSVMDRDLLPVDVLADMGWRHVERVWMPEWVAAPDAVVARLVAAAGGEPGRLRPAPSAPAAPFAPTGATAEQATRASDADAGPGSASAVRPAAEPAGSAESAPTAERDAPDGPADYRSWSPEGVRPRDILDRAETDPGARAQVIEMARAICDVEAPLTCHRLIVKICRAFDLSRTAASREKRIRGVLGDSFAYIDEHDFVWRTWDASLLPVSYRRGALDHVDSIEEIHPRELVALMAEVRATSPEWSSVEELCTQALRRLSARRRKLSAHGVLPALTAALKEAEAEDEA